MVAAVAACTRDDTPMSPRGPSHVNPLLTPTLVVTNTDDAGPGSLRQAIADATGGEIIQFEPGIAGGTIVLSSGPLAIDKALTIEGSQAAGMTISGNLKSVVFWVQATGDAVLRNLSIVNGFAQAGAGILTAGPLLLDHSLVANNQAGNGGGISASGAAIVTLVNSTVSGNTALDGGGIYSSGPPVNLRNSTVAMNSAGRGGGLFLTGALGLRNSIIARNTAQTATPSNNCYSPTNTLEMFAGMNIVDDDTCADPGEALLVTAAGVGPLASNGGPTMTHALALGSRAIDGGTQCSEPTDQRYVARNQGTSCDIGAYEFDAFVRLTLTTSPNAAVNPKTGELTVTGTVTCPSPYEVSIDASVNQTQKVTGRFPTIVQALGGTGLMPCAGRTPWSVKLTPQTGRFDNGTATLNADTFRYPRGFLPAAVSSPVKIFTVK
jgi:hypothetical protein